MQNRPESGQIFQHQDGGYYRYLGMVRHSDNQAPHVMYEHVWPFDTEGDAWVRPVIEWDSRFMAVTQQQLHDAMALDRLATQEAIKEHKAQRRAREAADKVSQQGAEEKGSAQ